MGSSLAPYTASQSVIERIRDRKRTKELLSDRKSRAAQDRMKSIAALASDGPSGGAGGARGKRKRGGGGGGGGGDKDDDFGADDEDWAVYRDIQGAEDSEEEEDDEQTLIELETKLLSHDASFTRNETLAARQARKRALTRTFLGGDPDSVDEEHHIKGRGVNGSHDAQGEDEEQQDDADKLEELARAHQVTLNVERARIAEVFFQPGMAGVDQAGVDEIMNMVVRSFDDDVRQRMLSVSNAFPCVVSFSCARQIRTLLTSSVSSSIPSLRTHARGTPLAEHLPHGAAQLLPIHGRSPAERNGGLPAGGLQGQRHACQGRQVRCLEGNVEVVFREARRVQDWQCGELAWLANR